MKKLDELEKGTLSRAADDEPVFVLRAKDRLAPMTVQYWADLGGMLGVDPDKTSEARQTARLMEKWAADNGGSKLPD